MESENVLHGWCVPAEWSAPTVVGGAGAWFWDEGGRRYLDMSSLAECMNLGHQHPRLIEAIRSQAERLCFVTGAWGAEPRARLAERLLELSRFEGGRVFFTLGGADANEHAVKFARAASGKPSGRVLTRERSYHGASYATGAWSGDTRTAASANGGAFGSLKVPPPYAYRCPHVSGDATACSARNLADIDAVVAREGVARLAAVLMEPNAGTNGIIAPPEHWPGLRALCTRHDILLIADEVMSGFGRCGEWFAWQAHGERGRPDLMTLAKGLTGAHLPLGAVVLSARIARRLDHEMLATGLTYGGHPLACAAGVAALDAYRDEGLIGRSRELGAWMAERLRGLQRRHAVVGDVRASGGLFAIVEFVADRRSRAPLAPWPEVHPALAAFAARGRDAGISFAIRGNLVILAPPLVISEQDLAWALDTMDRLIGEQDWT